MATNRFGLVSWAVEEKEKRPAQDFKKFEFVKLENGENNLRLVTSPYIYKTIKYKNPGDSDKKTRRIKSAAETSDCPGYAAGFAARSRYYAGVIDRSDNQLKLIDLSSSVRTKINTVMKMKGRANPLAYDICILKDADADPNNYYNVVPLSIEPLSDADIALVEESKKELEEALERLSAPLAPEAVLEKMKALGYQGGVICAEVENYRKADEERRAKWAKDSNSAKNSNTQEASGLPEVEKPLQDDEIDESDYDFTTPAT